MMAKITLDQWLAVSGLIIGIVGIILAIYFFRRSEKIPKPTFVTSPGVKTLVHPDLAKLGIVSIRIADRSIGERGISSVRVFFWNSGSRDIRSSDILKPFTVRSAAPILAAANILSTRDVTKSELVVERNPNGSEIRLSFSVLEPGDGVTFDVVYDGPPGERMEFSGVCVGAPKPTVLPSDGIYFMTKSSRFLNAYQPLIMTGIICGVFFPITFGVMWIANRLFGEHRTTILVLVVFGGFVVSMALYFAYSHYRMATAKRVPFETHVG